MRTHCYNETCPKHHPDCTTINCEALLEEGMYFCNDECKSLHWTHGENGKEITERSQASAWIKRNMNVMTPDHLSRSVNAYFKKYIIDDKRNFDAKKREVREIFGK